MSLYVNGKNIEMYSGDTGVVNFYGIPHNRIYDMYFEVKDTKRNTMFELTKKSEIVGVDSNNEVKMTMNEGETIEDFEIRVTAAGYTVQGRVSFFISETESEKITVSASNCKTLYYYGVKMCYTIDNQAHEDTLLPPVTKLSTGKVVFKDPTYIVVHPKYVEGE